MQIGVEFVKDSPVLFPQPVRASIFLIALRAGVAVAFCSSLLLIMWLPRLAPVLFIVTTATWLYAGWRVTVIRGHRL
jgi:hypothetical protein